MAVYQLQCDLGDLHLGVGLTMTDLLLLALLGLVLQDVDLLALAVLDDLGLNGGTLDDGSTDLGVLTIQDSQDLLELDGGLIPYLPKKRNPKCRERASTVPRNSATDHKLSGESAAVSLFA